MRLGSAHGAIVAFSAVLGGCAPASAPMSGSIERPKLSVPAEAAPHRVAREPLPAPLRFDGVYQSPPDHGTLLGSTVWKYLRFYPTGEVICVSSTDTVGGIERWFDLAEHDDLGTYVIAGSRLTFSCTSPHGTVEYEGTLQGEALEIDWHSLINDRRAHETYDFVALPGSEAGSPED